MAGKKDKKSKKENKAKEGKKPSENKKKEGKKPSENTNQEVSTTKYSGSLALSKMKHVLMNAKGKKGKKIKGIFIPLKENCLVEGDEGAVYMNINVITKTPQDQYGQNGFISQNGNKKWSEASEKEKDKFKSLPILGNIKNFEDAKSTNNDASGSMGDFDEDDDLPF